MTIGSFTLIKDEKLWIGPHLEAWLPILDQMVLFDGGSTDGTLEIIRHLQETHRLSYKIKLVEGKDPANLEDDYVRLFNECLWSLDTDLAAFIHPDMIPLRSKPFNLKVLDEAIAGSMRVRSFGGEPDAVNWWEIIGRGPVWKNIYRLRNPDLGAHYHGFYGAGNEDVYFSEITGDEYRHYGSDVSQYPYEVVDSGLEIAHLSDVRPYARRLDRMIKCLEHQGHSPEVAREIAPKHPRVTLYRGDGFDFKAMAPELRSEINAAQDKFKTFYREVVSV